jgi:hypothetical protein
VPDVANNNFKLKSLPRHDLPISRVLSGEEATPRGGELIEAQYLKKPERDKTKQARELLGVDSLRA